jgi:hypothetical protein
VRVFSFAQKRKEKISMLSLESEITARMQSSGVTADFLSALSGVSTSRMSAGLRNLKPFPNDTAMTLLALLREIEELVEQVRPIPVDLRNPQVIRGLLDDLRDAKSSRTTTPGEKSGCVLCGVFGQHSR